MENLLHKVGLFGIVEERSFDGTFEKARQFEYRQIVIGSVQKSINKSARRGNVVTNWQEK